MMCYDDDYECPNIRGLLRIYISGFLNRFYKPLKWKYIRWVCSRKGHDFKDIRTFEVKRFNKNYIQQRCSSCQYETRLLDAKTRKVIDSSEVNDIYGIKMWEQLEMESDIWASMPKEIWKSE